MLDLVNVTYFIMNIFTCKNDIRKNQKLNNDQSPVPDHKTNIHGNKILLRIKV